MSLRVVDSSVVIKWFVPETLEAEARQLRGEAFELHAPDFLDVEIAAIAWKKIRRGEIDRQGADFIVSQLPHLPVVRHPTAPLVVAAFDIADQTGRTVYDCLYLALAASLGGVMITADDKLVNALANTPWAASISGIPTIA